MGSVKDLTVIEEPSGGNTGRGRFLFSDRYSVFDWGEMPDLIPRKGEAIALLGAYFFEMLEDMKVPTHYLGLVEEGRAKKLGELGSPSNEMEVRLLNVYRPAFKDGTYDYSVYRSIEGCFLIPLEIIYRNILPPGSSVFRRMADGEISPGDLGLESQPEPGQRLASPMLDVSTKLESTDRYLKWEEARDISGITGEEEARLKNIALEADRLITGEFSRIGLVNEDGKFEFGFDGRRKPMFVDVLGTLDECRFTFSGMPVSKEIARIHYRGTPWHAEVEKAKQKDRKNWKKLCAGSPEPLPGKLLNLISDVYCACTNEITRRRWFTETPPFAEVMEGLASVSGGG